MKMRMIPEMMVVLLLMVGCHSMSETRPTCRPLAGYVPDAATAIRIAEAVWSPIYGKDMIESERPFVAELSGNIWTVTGSLPDGWVGGTAEIEIRKSDGTILRVIHGQ